MAYETKPNSGSLFRNEKKEEGSNQPDYTGTALIGGVEHFMDAWIKTAETGRKWMSFAFKPKDKQAAAPAQRRSYEDRDGPPF